MDSHSRPATAEVWRARKEKVALWFSHFDSQVQRLKQNTKQTGHIASLGWLLSLSLSGALNGGNAIEQVNSQRRQWSIFWETCKADCRVMRHWHICDLVKQEMEVPWHIADIIPVRTHSMFAMVGRTLGLVQQISPHGPDCLDLHSMICHFSYKHLKFCFSAAKKQ